MNIKNNKWQTPRQPDSPFPFFRHISARSSLAGSFVASLAKVPWEVRSYQLRGKLTSFPSKDWRRLTNNHELIGKAIRIDIGETVCGIQDAGGCKRYYVVTFVHTPYQIAKISRSAFKATGAGNFPERLVPLGFSCSLFAFRYRVHDRRCFYCGHPACSVSQIRRRALQDHSEAL